MSLVTIILTSYNRPKSIKVAIESVVAQTFQDWKLIVIDDHSKPETLKAIDGFCEKDQRIVRVNSTLDPGDRSLVRYAENINQALRLVTSPFVSYLTDDDFFYPQRLEKMLEVINHEEGRHLVYGHQERIFLDKDNKCTQSLIAYATRVLTNAYHVVDHNSVLHCTHCAEDVGYWSTDLSQMSQGDAAFWLRLSANGYLFYPVDVLGDRHYYHEKSVTKLGQDSELDRDL